MTLPTSVLTSKASISSAGKGQQVYTWMGWVEVAVEPAVEVSGVEDDRHAVVDRSHEFVRIGRDDGNRACAQGLQKRTYCRQYGTLAQPRGQGIAMAPNVPVAGNTATMMPEAWL